MRKTRWSKEDEAFLLEKWGDLSIKYIAKKLNRTETSIISKAAKFNLEKRDYWETEDFVTFCHLCKLLGIQQSYGYYKFKLLKAGFPFETKKLKTGKVRKVLVVYIKEFWKWTEYNQSKIDFKNFEKYALGPEPEWADKKRKRDIRKSITISTSEWSAAEDNKLKFLVNQYKYGYSYIAKELNRSIGAVIRRLNDLNIKARPLRENPHTSKWTDKQLKELENFILDREEYYIMEQVIGKSEKAIRGTVYRLYGSENIDKAYKNLIEQKQKMNGENISA